MKFHAASVAVTLLLAMHGANAFQSAFVPRRYGTSFLPTRTIMPATLAPPRDVPMSASDDDDDRRAAGATFSKKKHRKADMSMLVESSGGMLELMELTEQAESNGGNAGFLRKQIRQSPSFFKIASLASVPLSALLGFGLVPSRRLAAHAVGGVISGVAGLVGKSKLDSLTEGSAKPALAQAVVDAGLDDPAAGTKAVRAVQEQFGLVEEDFAILCTEIYTSYLVGMVKYAPQPKTAELKELENLRSALQLDNLQVGEAHATAAATWFRQTCLFTPQEDLEDPDHPDRQALDKLLFLTERALSQGQETPEAFKFEMTRVAKALNCDLTTAMERVHDTIEPFYQRALTSTRSKLGTQQVSAAMLERARKTLGVSDSMAFDLHVQAFNAEVKELLGNATDSETEDDATKESVSALSKLKFGDGAMERLEQLRDILGLSETDANYEIALEARPLYQETALAAMRNVLAGQTTADEAWSVMDARRQELLMPEESGKDLVSSMVMQALGAPLEECQKFAKVNNEVATYENLLDALEAKETLIAILAKSGWDEYEKFDEIFCNPWDRQSANGFLMSEDRIKLYRIFLKRSVRKAEDGKMTDEIFDRVMQVKGLLGISDQQAEIEARGAFGPQLQQALQKATLEIVDDFTPELAKNMKAEVDGIMQNYRLSEDFLRENGAGMYAKAVSIVSDKAPGGVPTKDLSSALEALQDLFQMENVDTQPAHMEYFGAVYKKSILEAMGSTGVIRDDYKGSLNDLRERLGVSEDDAHTLFLEAVEKKMTPMVEWIGSEMERTMLTQQQLSQRRNKDMGEDLFQSGKGADGVLGLGAEVNIMSDIMELVDFYVENDIISTQKIEKNVEADGAYKTVEEEVPFYPVTALGAGAIDQEVAELLYRQFIVGAFQSQGEKAARYEANRAMFAGILGLDRDKIDEINSNIGETVYDNFVSNAMKTKGTMDQQDMMFLANIQGKLNLSPEQGEKMLLQAQRKILGEEIEAIMDDPTPQTIKAFREKCNSLGIDLAADIGMSKTRLTRMFESEIVPGLQNGEISADNAAALSEVLESLGLEPEEGELMFESTLMRLSKNAMGHINGEVLRGREENTVDAIEELVRYAAFTDGDLGLNVEEATAHKVLNIFDAMDYEGYDRDRVEANKDLLKKAMNLPL